MYSFRRAIDGAASTSDVVCRLFGTTVALSLLDRPPRSMLAPNLPTPVLLKNYVYKVVHRCVGIDAMENCTHEKRIVTSYSHPPFLTTNAFRSLTHKSCIAHVSVYFCIEKCFAYVAKPCQLCVHIISTT